jgi:hypothetical protein
MIIRFASIALVATVLAMPRAVAAAEPETVMITLQARAGAEQALAGVLARHYEIARRLDLLQRGAPHVTLRRAEPDGKAFFVEILTWRDGSAPDAAPKEILAAWSEMNALVEPRGGRPGLDIAEMTIVTKER